MATRTYYQAESTGESTTTETTYQDKVTLAFTPGSGETWLIIGTWLLKNTAILRSYAKLTRTSGTATDFNEHIQRPQVSLYDYYSGGCFAYETFGESPGEQTYKIQYKAAGTAGIKEAKIIALKLETNDEVAVSALRSTYSGSTDWQDKVSLTFTPGSEGDYLILASCIMDIATAGYNWRTQLDVDGATQYDTTSFKSDTTTTRYPWNIVKQLTLSAAEHTIKIQYAAPDNTRVVGIAYAYIIALRLSDFPDSHYAETEARATTSSDSFQNRTTLTQTLPAVDHIVLASCGMDFTGTYQGHYQLTQDGISLGTDVYSPETSGEDVHTPYVCSKFLAAAAASYTWILQYKVIDVSDTAGIQEARIAVLQLETSGSFSPSISPSKSPSLSPSRSPSLSPSVGYINYTKGNYAALPSDAADLETNYTAQEIIDVGENDTVRVDQAAAGEYAIHQYKEYVVSDRGVSVLCDLQSSLAPSSSAVVLQVYNYNTAEWETLTQNNTANADTDFQLSASVTVDVADYKDGNMMAFRVYQLGI